VLFAGHLENVAKDRALQLAKKIYDGIVIRTPVRTGSLRASWRASLGQPDYSTINNGDPDNPLPPPVFPLTKATLHDTIHISNGQKYVLPIEFGWSSQAPQGMVRVTLSSLMMDLRVR